jgi:hypothetical protein
MSLHGLTDVGRRIVGIEIAPGLTPEGSVAAAERIFASLRARLGRWIGGDAFDALLDRAIAGARGAHPILQGVRWAPGTEASRLSGLDPHDAAVTQASVSSAVIAILDELTALLGRFIGEDLAERLVLEGWERAAPGEDWEGET